MKKTPKILPTYYKSKGTPIFRDTTALPFALGGPIEDNPVNPNPQWNRPQLSEERVAALKALHGDSIFASANPNDLLFYDLNKEAVDSATDFSTFLDPAAVVGKSFTAAPTTKDIKTRLSKGWALDTKTGTYFKVPDEVYKELVVPKEQPMELMQIAQPALINQNLPTQLVGNEAPVIPSYTMPGYKKDFPAIYMRAQHAGQLIPHARPTLTTHYKPSIESRITQKLTGYDPAYMEGSYDQEGNYIPGELENAAAQNRVPNFVGASSLQDLRKQKDYLEEVKNIRGYALGGRLSFEPSGYASIDSVHYADGGPIYTYDKRPGSYYQKTSEGWMISNAGTNNQYVPIDDPTGERTRILNQHATVYKPQPQIVPKIYADPLSRNSETVQNVAAKTMPQSKQQWQDYETVKKDNQARRSTVAKALEVQGMTPKQAADTVASYGSDWPTLEAAKAKDIQIMNNTAANIQAGINPYKIEEYIPREEQSIAGKALDIAFNPMTTAGYLVRGQEIPDYMGEKADNGTLGYWSNGQFIQGRNSLDTVTDMATPIGWAHSAYNILNKAANNKSGDFWTEENAWDALNVIPGIGLAAKGMKYSPLLNRVSIGPKSTAANLAVDAGSVMREPFYAPQRASFLHPGISPAQQDLMTVQHVNNTTILSPKIEKPTPKLLGEDYRSPDKLPEYMNPYLYTPEQVARRFSPLQHSYFKTLEMEKAADKIIKRNIDDKVYYDLEGNIIKTPLDNY
jgi:hypothetical protein